MIVPWREKACFSNSSVIYFLSPIEKQNVILYAVLYLKKRDEELLFGNDSDALFDLRLKADESVPEELRLRFMIRLKRI